MFLKNIHSFILFFSSIQLSNQFFYPFHLTYNLTPFLLVTFSVLNYFWFALCNSLSLNILTISSPLISLITHVHGTVFLTLLISKASSDQFATLSFAKIFLDFGIITLSPTLNLGPFLLIFVSKSIIF